MKTTSTIILCGCALFATALFSCMANHPLLSRLAGRTLQRCFALVSAVFISFAGGLLAQDFEGKTITGLEIRYTGAKEVDEARIRELISSKPGATYRAETLDKDVLALIRSGLIDDVRFLAEEAGGGVKLIAEVATRMEYVAVGFVGNTVYSDGKLAQETKLPNRGVLNDDSILAARNNLENYYHERGYPDTTVEHRVQPSAKAGKMELVFVINEGGKIEIRKIRFEGNHAFPDQELLKEVKGKEQDSIKFDQLYQGLDAVLDYYRSKGHLRVRCPGIRREPVADGLVDIVIPINEGEIYTVAGVSFGGLTALKLEELQPALTLNADDVFSSKKLRADLSMIRNRYGALGYADVVLSPDILDEGPNRVSIIHSVIEGSRFRVGKVNIRGNIITADEVIRREIPLKPGDWFNPVELEACKERLIQVKRFREVEVSGSPSAPGVRDVEVVVKE